MSYTSPELDQRRNVPFLTKLDETFFRQVHYIVNLFLWSSEILYTECVYRYTTDL
jgi:hypothetical protein